MAKTRFQIDEYLQTLPMFSRLRTEQIARLAEASTEIEAPRGTVIHHRGEPSGGLHVVVYGQVKLALQTARGAEMVVELVEEGALFGVAALFCDRPHILIAESLLDSKLVHVAKEALLGEINTDPEFSRRVIALLGERLYTRLQELETCFLNSGIERVARFLLHGRDGHGVQGYMRVTLPANKGIIASRLNLTHEHFSRILRELITAGLIEVEGREVRILDERQLYAYAGA